MKNEQLRRSRQNFYGGEYVFGLPGDGINSVMEALRQRQDKIKFTEVRHEETVAFMACG